MMADGLTVDSIASKGWTILLEAESDWRSHAATVAQFVKVIKRHLKVQFSHDISCLVPSINEICYDIEQCVYNYMHLCV
jgi:hypothetical protein